MFLMITGSKDQMFPDDHRIQGSKDCDPKDITRRKTPLNASCHPRIMSSKENRITGPKDARMNVITGYKDQKFL
jgi:hypothetical protein